MANIALLGGGAWGSALALALARAGNTVKLWIKSPEEWATLATDQRHPIFPEGTLFPAHVQFTHNLKEALSHHPAILIATPSHAFASVLSAIQPYLSEKQGIASATKGLDPEGTKLQHETAHLMLPNHPFAIVTGPSFAGEVARNLPTALLVASSDQAHRHQWRTYLHHDTLRIYESADVVGAEIGGIVKNVLAIAAGISDGLSFGSNARAALITRGLAEMTRLALAMGGQAETLSGLSGLGDLVLTATDNQSRNRRLGLALAQGSSLEEACKNIGAIVEGAQNAEQLHILAQKHQIDMPICHAVYSVLYKNLAPRLAVQHLLERASGAE